MSWFFLLLDFRFLNGVGFDHLFFGGLSRPILDFNHPNIEEEEEVVVVVIVAVS